MAGVPGEFTWHSDATFSGRDGEWTNHYSSYDDALSYAEGIRSGELDPFLGQTWTTIDVSRSRNPDGTFADGWDVFVHIVRPDDSEMGEISP